MLFSCFDIPFAANYVYYEMYFSWKYTNFWSRLEWDKVEGRRNEKTNAAQQVNGEQSMRSNKTFPWKCDL